MADTGKIIIDIEIDGNGVVNVERLDNSLKDLGNTVKNTNNDLKETIRVLREEANALDRESEAYKRLKKEIDFYNAALKKSKSSIDLNTTSKIKNVKATTQMQDKTGLAGAATVELGRTISDANYGFTAMANNISQLATLFTTLIATTGGVKNAATAMWTALKGPLGAIVVFQILVALFEKLAMNAKSSTREVNKLNDALAEVATQQTNLEAIALIFRTSEENTNSWTNSLKELKKKGFDPVNESLDEFLERTRKANELEAEFKVKTEEHTEAVKELERVNEDIKKQEEQISELKENGGWGEGEVSVYYWMFGSDKKDVEEAQKKLNIIKGELLDLQKRRQELMKQQDEGKGKSSVIPELDFEEDIREQLRDNALAVEDNEIEKIRLKEKYAKEDVDIQLKAFEEKMNILKLEEGANVDAINARIEEARRGAELFKSVISVGFGIEARQLGLDLVNDIREGVKMASASEIGGSELSPDEILNAVIGTDEQVEEIARKKAELIVKQFNANSLADELNLWADSFSNVFDFVDSEFQRQLDSQQAYTNEQNNILREQLNNENLSAEGRKKIQGQIAANDEKSRQKQDEIKKKRFMANKAFGIAEAGINTYSAALKVLNDPTLVGQPWARIPLAASTIGFGLTQMAMIARQKFVPTASSTPIAGGGAGGSGGGDRVFDFNLVGESPESQLNRTIQNQFEKPLQAYVVSKDISSQQELDLNIRNSAKI